MSTIFKAISAFQKSLPFVGSFSTSSFKPESLARTLGGVQAKITRKLDIVGSRNDLALANLAARSSLQFANGNHSKTIKSHPASIKCINECDPSKFKDGDYCGYCG